MALSAGDIEYSIDVNTQGLLDARRQITALNSRIDTGFSRNSRSTETLATRMTKLAGAIGSVLALNQLAGFVTNTANAVDKQKKFADRLGISFEALQKLQFAASQTGVGAEVLNVGLQRMSRRLKTVAQGGAPEVRKQLELMGLSFKELDKLSPDQQFMAIADGMNTLSEAGDKTTATFAIFDSGAVGLNNTFKVGSKGIIEYGNELETLGGIISTQTASDFETFNDQLEKVGISADAVGINILASLSPAMVTVSVAIAEFVKDGKKMEDLMNGIGTAVMATSSIIIGRGVVAFSAYITTQVAAGVAAARTAGIITASGSAMTFASVRALALAGSTRVLSGALALLGGPVGILIAVITSLALMDSAADKSADSLKKAKNEANDLSDSFKKMTDDKLGNELSAMQEDFDGMRETVKRLNGELNNAPKDSSFLDLEKKREQIKFFTMEMQKLSEKSKVLMKIRFDKQQAEKAKEEARSTAKEIKQIFERESKTFSISDFIGLTESATLGNSNARQKQAIEEKKSLDEIKAAFSQHKQFSAEFKKAENDIIAKGIADRKKLSEDELKVEKEKNDKISQKLKEGNDELKAKLEEASRIRQSWINKFKSIVDANEVALASPTELIAISERKAIENLNKINSSGILKETDYIEQLRVIKLIHINQQKKLDDEDLDNKKAKADKVAEQQAKDIEAQKKSNEAFNDAISSGKNRSPLEQLVFKETEAVAKLKELYEASTEPFEVFQQGLTDIQEKFSQQRQELREQEAANTLANASMISGASADLFGALANAAKDSQGETSSAYRAMFAISKGFAVAQAGLNLALAITNALASGPYPANLAAVASVAASGASFVGAVSGATYSGRANGGDISAGNQYKVNENGRPEVLSVGGSDYLTSSRNARITPLEQFGGGGGGGNMPITIINQTTGRIDQVQQSITKDQVVLIIKETVPAEIANSNSRTSRAITNSTNSSRRLT